MASINAGPHYEVPATELATWLVEQGKDRWWNVDGDPLLTGLLTFPCPAGDLATTLMKINRPILIQAKKDDTAARGQLIDRNKLGQLVSLFSENQHVAGSGTMPSWGNDRLFYCCWKGSRHEWLLAEDSESTEQFRTSDHDHTTSVVDVKRD
jgi:hypothetical protein